MVKHKKIGLTSFGVFAALTVGLLQQAQATPPAQQSTLSVAEAARRAREQKKDQKPAAKIYTNDDVANLKGAVSVVGPAPAPPPATAEGEAKPADASAGSETATPAAGTADRAATAAPVKDEAYWRKSFADARKKQADDAKELYILQREYNLKQQQYYTDPNVALREQNSNKDLNDTQQQINTKKADVEKDKLAIAAMEDDLRKAGGDTGWSR